MHKAILYLLISMARIHAWTPNTTLNSLLASALPANLSNFTMAESYSDTQMVIFGGSDGTKMLNNAYVFNLTAMIWVEITSVGPSPRMNSCSIVHQGNFYLFGGQNATQSNSSSTSYSSELWRLNLVNETW